MFGRLIAAPGVDPPANSRRRALNELAELTLPAVRADLPLDDVLRTAALVDDEIAELRSDVQHRQRRGAMHTIANWTPPKVHSGRRIPTWRFRSAGEIEVTHWSRRTYSSIQGPTPVSYTHLTLPTSDLV